MRRAEALVAVAHGYPFSVIRCQRDDGGPEVAESRVNKRSIRKKAPDALRTRLSEAGRDDGFRATLRRSRQPRDKPLCDSPRRAAPFEAEGV